MLPVEIADGGGAGVHLGVLQRADEDVGGGGGVAGRIGDLLVRAMLATGAKPREVGAAIAAGK